MTARKSTAAKAANAAPRDGTVPVSRKSGGGAPVPAPLAPRFHRYALPRTGTGARYWLMKTEPDAFSFDDLMRAKDRTTCWDGVRNFQARNFMRDHMRMGDWVLIYHSNAEPPAVAGIARVVSTAYPDHTAFDPTDDHFDPNSDPESPTWIMVDVQGERALTPVALGILRETPGLEAMELLQRGSRLSITPLTKEEWTIVTRLGGVR